MEQNKLHLQLQNNKNDNIIIHSNNKYCSKCLGTLDEDIVRDHEGNEFCSWECKVYFHRERRMDMDDILSDLK